MKPTNWNTAKDVTEDILLHWRARGFLNLYLGKKECTSAKWKQQGQHSKEMLGGKNQTTVLGKRRVVPVDFCDTTFPTCASLLQRRHSYLKPNPHSP